MDAVLGLKLLAQVDMLALNKEEAAALGGTPNADDKLVILDACLRASAAANPKIRLIVSSGAEGISVFDQGEWSHHPAIPTSVVSSAGAGDALLAGVIAGIVAGLPFVSRDYQEPSVRKRRSAIDLGLLVAAFSLTSPHTIHPDFSQQTLWEFDKTAVSHG
jgi:sugar/nucleoside kinase (ribokinase family)